MFQGAAPEALAIDTKEILYDHVRDVVVQAELSAAGASNDFAPARVDVDEEGMAIVDDKFTLGFPDEISIKGGDGTTEVAKFKTWQLTAVIAKNAVKRYQEVKILRNATELRSAVALLTQALNRSPDQEARAARDALNMTQPMAFDDLSKKSYNTAMTIGSGLPEIFADWKAHSMNSASAAYEAMVSFHSYTKTAFEELPSTSVQKTMLKNVLSDITKILKPIGDVVTSSSSGGASAAGLRASLSVEAIPSFETMESAVTAMKLDDRKRLLTTLGAGDTLAHAHVMAKKRS